MATRPKGYGFSGEIQRKIAGKYDPELELECREWIEAICGIKLEPEFSSEVTKASYNFHQAMKDGVVLCDLMNTLQPGSIKKVNRTTKMAFKLMENINMFLMAAEKYGVNKMDCFQTVDLYENQNMHQVVLAIHSLGRAAQKNNFDGPVLGVREASANKREFSEEQMRAGKNVIGLQMGTNKGASQAGMSFGTQRHINDIKSDEMCREGQDTIGLQAGSNKGASQAGQSFGKPRHIVD